MWECAFQTSPSDDRLRAAFAMRPGLADRLFGAAELERIHAVADLDEDVTISDFARADPGLLAALDVLVTGWGCPELGAAELDAMPRLRAVVHAGGSVKSHVGPDVWSRGILVTSAADANASPVAEYTLAAILQAGKAVPELASAYARDPGFSADDRDDIGNYGRTVGILGASRVGRRVIELLGSFDFTVLLYDPYVSDDDPVLARARRVSLDDLFRRSSIVSIHAPLLPETIGLVAGPPARADEARARCSSTRPGARSSTTTPWLTRCAPTACERFSTSPSPSRCPPVTRSARCPGSS